MDTHPSPVPFSIDLDGYKPKVTVAGQDITQELYSVAFAAEARELPRLTLNLRPRAGRIEAEGIVMVNESPDDVAKRHADFTASVELLIRHTDLGELRARVDASMTSMASDPLAATVTAIADMFHEVVNRDDEPLDDA